MAVSLGFVPVLWRGMNWAVSLGPRMGKTLAVLLVVQ